MTQSEEPEQTPAPAEAAESAESAEPTQALPTARPVTPAEAAAPVAPAGAAEPTQVLHTAQPVTPAQAATPPAPAGASEPTQFLQTAQPQPFGTYPNAAYPADPFLDPQAQAFAAAAAADAAAKKAKRRGIVVKTAVLAVPGLVLVALLAATTIEAGSLSSKTNAASAAAKSANVAASLAGDLRAAQTAAQGSILVDAGCVAVESQATKKMEDKLIADGETMDKAANGTSFNAFAAASNTYIDDLQRFSTSLQQDAALSKRSSVTAAVGAITTDLKSVISSTQDMLGGDFSNSVLDKLDSAGNHLDTDATAVDTMCGGSTLNGSSDSSLGSGSLSA